MMRRTTTMTVVWAVCLGLLSAYCNSSSVGSSNDSSSGSDTGINCDLVNCNTDCPVGEVQCMGQVVQECWLGSLGCCGFWAISVDCADASQFCDGSDGTAACADPACDNGLPDYYETDVDCGGLCPPCPSGAACLGPDDCESGICTAQICD